MKTKTYIQQYCTLKNNQVFLNGGLVFQKEKNEGLSSFLKEIYREKNIQYPKFFKMDDLCKLGIIASEYVLENQNIENAAVVFSNKASSLVTDRKHQESISDKENYFPSPSIFVYTLPNIVMGEICIKQKFTHENAFFIFDEYFPEFHHNYEAHLIQTQKTNHILAGWIEVDEDNYHAFLYTISTEKGELEHKPEILTKLYTQNE